MRFGQTILLFLDVMQLKKQLENATVNKLLVKDQLRLFL